MRRLGLAYPVREEGRDDEERHYSEGEHQDEVRQPLEPNIACTVDSTVSARPATALRSQYTVQLLVEEDLPQPGRQQAQSEQNEVEG